MVVKNKKTRLEENPENISSKIIDRRIEEIVQRGGGMVSESTSVHKEARFTLRIPGKILKKVGEAIGNREIRVSMNQWILEAILYSLEKK